jgi:hypothetical protein
MAGTRKAGSKCAAPRRTFESLEARYLLSSDPILLPGWDAIVFSAESAAGDYQLPGDYNSDDHVDAADYGVWRDTFGQVGPMLPADGNLNDAVDPDDFNVWKANFGRSQDHPHNTEGVTLHSGDYVPPIANHPTHVFESDWSGTDATSRVVVP